MTDGRESLAKNAAGALMMTMSWFFSRRGRRRFTIATILTGIVLAFGVVRPEMVFGQTPGRLVAPNGKSLSGTILGTSPTDVEIEDEDGDLKRVPLDKIVEVQFSDEPPKLASARSFLMRGRSGDALGELESVLESELEGVPALVLAEMEFVKAAATGQIAVESGDGVPAADAMVIGFLAKHPRSHHFFEMQQLLGELRSKAGNYPAAMQAFDALSKGPVAFKIQASNGKGQVLVDEGKFAEAVREYDAALAASAGDEVSLMRKREAALGKARALSRLGKHADAIKLAKATIDDADPEDRSLLSRAYVVLGSLYRAMEGKDQDALIAYLTVDLVYNTVPDSHAEALYYLSELWAKAREEQRSRQTGQILRDAYPQSGWAKKLAAGGKTS
jgi:tetratricopeptide (TPR) repeat protein